MVIKWICPGGHIFSLETEIHRESGEIQKFLEPHINDFDSPCKTCKMKGWVKQCEDNFDDFVKTVEMIRNGAVDISCKADLCAFLKVVDKNLIFDTR